MKKSLILIITFLLVVSLGFVSSARFNGGDIIEVYDCQVLDQEGATYVLQNDIIGGPNRCIKIENDSITLDLGGYTMDDESQVNSAIFSDGFKNLTIKNGKLENYLRGLYLRNSDNILIENLEMKETWFGVFLKYSDNPIIRNNKIDNSGRGLLLTGINNGLIENNLVINSQSIGLEAYSLYNNKITNNEFDGNAVGLEIAGNSSNNLIISNLISNTLGDGPNHPGVAFHIINSPFNEISDNIITNAQGDDIVIWAENEFHCDQIIENNQHDNPFFFYNSKNRIIENQEAGEIILCNADNSIIRNVNLTDKGGGNIYLLFTDNSKLSNIHVFNNSEGIILENSNNNTIENSDILNSRDEGIVLEQSNYNIIRNNNIIYGIDGIELEYSSHNIITGNNIFGNSQDGIEIREFYPEENPLNFIFNNFFNNENNFFYYFDHSESVDYWNTEQLSAKGTKNSNIIGGMHLGGNYWATPDGTGYSQTCSDKDDNGICDEPYQLANNNIDFYPLTY